MSRVSQTIIVSSNREEGVILTELLNQAEFSRIRFFEETNDAWEYLTSTHHKSSIELFFLSANDVRRAKKLLTKIMTDQNLSHIHVVIIANSELKNISLLFQHGAIGLMTKPLTIEKINTVVDRLPSNLKKAACG